MEDATRHPPRDNQNQQHAKGQFRHDAGRSFAAAGSGEDDQDDATVEPTVNDASVGTPSGDGHEFDSGEDTDRGEGSPTERQAEPADQASRQAAGAMSPSEPSAESGGGLGLATRIRAWFKRLRRGVLGQDRGEEHALDSARIPAQVQSSQTTVPEQLRNTRMIAMAEGDVELCEEWMARSSSTFLGKVADQIALSRELADRELQRADTPIPQPDLGFLARARSAFQTAVWLLVITVPLGSLVILRYGDAFVQFIGALPDVPEQAVWNPNGWLTPIWAAVRQLFSYKETWVAVLVLALSWWVWRQGKRYWRADLLAQVRIGEYRVASENAVRAVAACRQEQARLESLSSAFSPLAELLAWIVYEPVPRSFGSHHEPQPLGEGRRFPNAVRFGDLELSEPQRLAESRTAIELMAWRGYLHRVLMQVAEATRRDSEEDGKEVLRQLILADTSGTGRDVRARLLTSFRSGEIQPKLGHWLSGQVRANRRGLATRDRGGQGFFDAAVRLSDDEVVQLAPFLSDILGPASAFVADLWTPQRQADGGPSGGDGDRVGGSFQTYLWHLPQFVETWPRRGDVSITCWDPVVVGDELSIASMRLDFAQPEPAPGFACFEGPAPRQVQRGGAIPDDDL